MHDMEVYTNVGDCLIKEDANARAPKFPYKNFLWSTRKSHGGPEISKKAGGNLVCILNSKSKGQFIWKFGRLKI